MSEINMFKSARLKRAEKELAELKDDREQQFKLLMESMSTAKRLANRNLKLHDELLDMVEARDAVSAASKFLRDRCDMQDAVLKLVATYGEKNPECCTRIAKAVVNLE